MPFVHRSIASVTTADLALILRPGLYATRAKYHGYRDGALDAVRAHLDPFDISNFNMAFSNL
jgi:hypothetical protein